MGDSSKAPNSVISEAQIELNLMGIGSSFDQDVTVQTTTSSISNDNCDCFAPSQTHHELRQCDCLYYGSMINVGEQSCSDMAPMDRYLKEKDGEGTGVLRTTDNTAAKQGKKL
jgi:hypothetical protein